MYKYFTIVIIVNWNQNNNNKNIFVSWNKIKLTEIKYLKTYFILASCQGNTSQ